MKDYLGRDLGMGDVVTSTFLPYADLRTFRIVGFTAQKVRIVLLSPDHDGYMRLHPVLKSPSSVCLVAKTHDIGEILDLIAKLDTP